MQHTRKRCSNLRLHHPQKICGWRSFLLFFSHQQTIPRAPRSRIKPFNFISLRYQAKSMPLYPTINFLDAPRKEEYKWQTEEREGVQTNRYPTGRHANPETLSELSCQTSLPLFDNQMIISVIAGSWAIKNHKLRQVRKEAAVVTLFMCSGVPGYPFFHRYASPPPVRMSQGFIHSPDH